MVWSTRVLRCTLNDLYAASVNEWTQTHGMQVKICKCLRHGLFASMNPGEGRLDFQSLKKWAKMEIVTGQVNCFVLGRCPKAYHPWKRRIFRLWPCSDVPFGRVMCLRAGACSFHSFFSLSFRSRGSSAPADTRIASKLANSSLDSQSVWWCHKGYRNFQPKPARFCGYYFLFCPNTCRLWRMLLTVGFLGDATRLAQPKWQVLSPVMVALVRKDAPGKMGALLCNHMQSYFVHICTL